MMKMSKSFLIESSIDRNAKKKKEIAIWFYCRFFIDFGILVGIDLDTGGLN